MVNEFIIPQKLSLWDFYRASLYLGIRNKRLRRLLYFIAIIGVLNLVLTLGLNTKPNNTTLIPVFQVLLPFLILVLFFFAGTFIICGLIKLLRPGIFKNMTYQFTHWGMYKKSDTIDHSIPWRNIIKVKETGEIIGGYNPLEWKSSGFNIKAKDSFIFSFKNKDNFRENPCYLLTFEGAR